MFGGHRGATVNWGLALRLVIVSVLAAALLTYAVWPFIPGRAAPGIETVIVYGFSILHEVMNESVYPAFQAMWAEETGRHVEFISSFSASGTVTNQIIMGVPAEIAILSFELDALRLVEAGVLTGPTWRDLPHGGVLNRTPFIILVRQGNPLGISGFSDLGSPGIGVVHPDPLTSGGANWAIIAEYGAELRRDPGRPDLAYQTLLGIWANVVARSSSARGARTQFEGGFGDALITYEQEAVRDRARGRLAADIVYPESTVLSEHIVVVIDRNVAAERRDLIDSFVDFLWSDEAQALFVEHGFRSVHEDLNRANPDFGHIEDPFLISDFGGWQVAKRDIL